jgi:hypothetical protein
LINDFKVENPQYQVSVEVGLSLRDGRDNAKFQDYWFHIYFYYPQENKIIWTWTRPAGKQQTTLAFVAIGHVGSWKFINKDFGFFENRKQKKMFEERILNKIKEKIEK